MPPFNFAMNERRKFKRIQRDPLACNISFDMAKHPGAIIEESIGGLKIRGLDLLVLPEDAPIQIEHLGVSQTGVVRNASRNSEKFEIGISLQNADVENFEVKNLLLSCFIYENEHLVACQPVEIDQDENIRIVLWDGREKTVRRNELTPLTRYERKQVLEATPDHVAYLRDQYLLDADQNNIIDAILHYEFVVQEAVGAEN